MVASTARSRAAANLREGLALSTGHRDVVLGKPENASVGYQERTSAAFFPALTLSTH